MRPEPIPDVIPDAVTALVGAGAVERRGAGGWRVLSGNGLVAKVGPPALVTRERWILERRDLPVAVPAVVAGGPGWLVTAEIADRGGPWSDIELDEALTGLGRLHDTFEGAVPPDATAVLRRPLVAIDETLAPARQDRIPLPPPLDALLSDPGPLLAVLGGQPDTLTHGDPWPGNIRRPPGAPLVWCDWEHASMAPAATDVASWLDQTPWHLDREVDPARHLAVYLASRRRRLDHDAFRRAVDSAVVIWFFAFDVPRLAAGDASPAMADAVIAASLAAAGRAVG